LNFISIRRCDPYIVEVADGRFEKANVYYAPWMSNSLISISQLRGEGLFFSNRKHGLGILTNINTGEEVLHVKENHGMYPITTWKPGSAMSVKVVKPLTVMEAHARLGHIAPDAVRKLVRNGTATCFEVDLSTPNEDLPHVRRKPSI